MSEGRGSSHCPRKKKKEEREIIVQEPMAVNNIIYTSEVDNMLYPKGNPYSIIIFHPIAKSHLLRDMLDIDVEIINKNQEINLFCRKRGGKHTTT